MARVPNPNWWLVGGGIAAAAALGTYGVARCRARTISIDQLNLGEYGKVYRWLRYKGCFEPLPYEVVVTTVNPEDFILGGNWAGFEDYVLLRQSFDSLEKARNLGAEKDRESNPGEVGPAYRAARSRARRKANPCC